MEQTIVIQKAVTKVGGVLGPTMEIVDGAALAGAAEHLRRRMSEARVRRIAWTLEDVEAARLVMMGLVALADDVVRPRSGGR